MYTECPTCFTMFKVTTAQLKSAEGRVRCGNCDNVFNAIAYLTDEVPAEAQLKAGGAASAPAVGPDFDSISMPNEGGRDVASTIERSSSPAPKAPKMAAAAISAADLNSQSVAYRPDSDPFADALGSSTQPAAGRARASIKSEAAVESTSAFDLGAFSEPSKGKPDSMAPKSRIPVIDDLEEPESAEQFVLEELKGSGGRKFGGLPANMGWALLIGVLVIGLLGQFVYFKRADLNKYATGRIAVDAVCSAISSFKSCETAPQRDLQAIELVERDVRPHPSTKGALLVTATIRNKAEFAQPYPELELSFSDINQKLLAQRKFKAEEYLAPELDIGAGMKPSLPIRVQIELVDPGPEAVNFEFNFR